MMAYRFDPKDERRSKQKNTLFYYPDFGYEFTFGLDGKPFSTILAGIPQSKATITLDRDGNGRISQNDELIVIGEPFNFTGTSYVLSARDGELSLTKSTKEIDPLPLPPDLSIGKLAPEFTATAMDGRRIVFPRDYAGKLVMLDFWATWCGPCLGEIPHMREAYETHRNHGFEILEVTLDQKDMPEALTEVIKAKEFIWPQIYERKFGDTRLAKMYDISSIPFVLLVDGDTGVILAGPDQLRGDTLPNVIADQLDKKNLTPKR